MKKQPPRKTALQPATACQLSSNDKQRLSAGSLQRRAGKIKYGCLAWLIGLPLPIVILLMFYKGCDF